MATFTDLNQDSNAYHRMFTLNDGLPPPRPHLIRQHGEKPAQVWTECLQNMVSRCDEDRAIVKHGYNQSSRTELGSTQAVKLLPENCGISECHDPLLHAHGFGLASRKGYARADRLRGCGWLSLWGRTGREEGRALPSRPELLWPTGLHGRGFAPSDCWINPARRCQRLSGMRCLQPRDVTARKV